MFHTRVFDDFVSSREYNGLGTFSYGLHLADQDVVEYQYPVCSNTMEN